MTYLFVVIGGGLTNALFAESVSLLEIILVNALIIILIWSVETFISFNKVQLKSIIYENIENIKPENKRILISDLEKRLGVIILDYEVCNVDFLKDIAEIKIKCTKNP